MFPFTGGFVHTFEHLIHFKRALSNRKLSIWKVSFREMFLKREFTICVYLSTIFMQWCQTTELLKSMRIWLPSCKQLFNAGPLRVIIGDQYGKTVKISQRFEQV